MDFYKIMESDIPRALSEPEEGMGFQKADLSRHGSSESGILIGGEYFVTHDDAPFLPNPPTALLESRDLSEGLLVTLPLSITELDGLPEAAQRHLSSVGSFTTKHKAGTLPPHSTTTSSGDVFYRLSAHRYDRRILPNKSLAAGSYSTTDTDITIVPSGLAAVGRYALPIRVSAKHVFKITPAPGTPILYGTVTPNYGLAGGGVEVYFPKGTTPGTVTFFKTISEK